MPRLAKNNSIFLDLPMDRKDLGGMTGNFLTTYSKASTEPRPLPAIGTKTFCHGKVIGYIENNFCVEIISFDHCGNAPRPATSSADGESTIKDSSYSQWRPDLKRSLKPPENQ